MLKSKKKKRSIKQKLMTLGNVQHNNIRTQKFSKPRNLGTKAKPRKIQYNLEKQPQHNNQSLGMLNITCLNHQKNKKKNQKKKQKAKSMITINKK